MMRQVDGVAPRRHVGDGLQFLPVGFPINLALSAVLIAWQQKKNLSYDK
jgi:hypothetical protein